MLGQQREGAREMPRRRRGEWEIEKSKALRAEYGGHLNLAQIQRELGCKDRRTAEEWLGDMPYIRVGSQRKWSAEEIAEKLYYGRIIPA